MGWRSTATSVLLLMLCSFCATAQTKESSALWVVGFDDDFAPLSGVNSAGQPAGMGVELIKAIAQQEGVELRFQVGSWQALRTGLERGDIDVITSMAYSRERAQAVDFTVPYVHGELRLLQRVRREGSRAVRSIERVTDLATLPVAVVEDSIGHDFLRRYVPESSLILVESRSALQALALKGDVDYLMSLDVLDTDLEVNQRFPGFEPVVIPDASVRRWMAIATAKGRDDIRFQINHGLAELLGSGAYQALQEKWLSELQPRQFSYSSVLQLVLAIVGIGGVVALVLLMWSWTLKREVARQARLLIQESTARHKLEKRLLQGQKLEALGQLSGGVAHDFNNILASILGYAGLAQERLEGQPGKVGGYVAQIDLAARRAAELVEQLLLFSRSQSGEAKPVEPAEMMREVSLLLKASLPKSVSVEIDAPENLGRLFVNPVKLHQVLLNLCVNARDAIQGAGRISIRSRRVVCSADVCASCGASLSGPWIEISVADNGSGIAADVLPKIFRSGFTTKGESLGIGQGLLTVHEHMHASGGHVLVTSREGEGSEFRLLLPEAEQAGRQAASGGERVPDSGRRAQQILLLDQDQGFRTFLQEFLQSKGYVVRSFSEREQLLKALLLAPDQYDLALVVSSPSGKKTRQLIEQLLSVRSTLPVLALGEVHAGVPAHEFKASGGVRYLPKPVELPTLLVAIEEILSTAVPEQGDYVI